MMRMMGYLNLALVVGLIILPLATAMAASDDILKPKKLRLEGQVCKLTFRGEKHELHDKAKSQRLE